MGLAVKHKFLMSLVYLGGGGRRDGNADVILEINPKKVKMINMCLKSNSNYVYIPLLIVIYPFNDR